HRYVSQYPPPDRPPGPAQNQLQLLRLRNCTQCNHRPRNAGVAPAVRVSAGVTADGTTPGYWLRRVARRSARPVFRGTPTPWRVARLSETPAPIDRLQWLVSTLRLTPLELAHPGPRHARSCFFPHRR